MLKDQVVGFLGAGNMAEALIEGLIYGKLCSPGQIICSDVKETRLKFIGEKYSVKTASSNQEVVREASVVILAVKPQIMKEAVGEVAGGLDLRKLVISIAAGISMNSIEACAGKELKLIRVMPNICVAVREGVSALAGGRHATDGDRRLAKEIFDAVGKSLFIEENLLDAVTGLSGSGPAYIFLIIDALADAGVKVGLARNDALLLASQTVLGAAKMMIETGEHPGKLKDMVTSPGGTAITGLHTLEEGGLRTTLINAVEKATNRSRSLGEIMKRAILGNNQIQG